MEILIKKAKIISSKHLFNGKIKDIFIKDGIILDIDDNISQKSDLLIDRENLHISIGWFDFGVNVGFPKSGLETLETINNASAKGGFTEIGVYSSEYDEITTLHEVSYYAKLNSVINYFPIPSATKFMKGKELNDSFILKNNGAIAFCDNKKPIKSSILEKIIFEYNTNIDSVSVIFAYNEELANKGMVNESKNTLFTGLKTIPSITETTNLARDIEMLEYSDAKVHIQCISLSKSVEMLKNAKKKGLKITSHITPYNLILNDIEICNFNTNAKVLPPLRGEHDNISLKEGILEGIIDFISSDHTPVFVEEKNCEFDIAKYGSIGLESCFPSVYKYLEKDITLDNLIDIFSVNPRKIFGINIPEIEKNHKANITLFNPDKQWIFSEEHICSKQKNSIFLGKEMRGEVYGIINNGNYILN